MIALKSNKRWIHDQGITGYVYNIQDTKKIKSHNTDKQFLQATIQL